MAWIGQPHEISEITVTNNSSGLRIPSNAVPLLLLNVFLHILHLYLPLLESWMTIFPCPIFPAFRTRLVQAIFLGGVLFLRAACISFLHRCNMAQWMPVLPCS